MSAVSLYSVKSLKKRRNMNKICDNCNCKNPLLTDSLQKVSSYPSDLLSDLQDTIHYLSPASTISSGSLAFTHSRSDYEGYHELDYQKITGYPRFIYGIERSLSTESPISCVEARVQRTIAIVKPQAMIYKDVVLRTVLKAGLDIIARRTVHLTPEQIAEIYAQHYGSPSFPHLVVSMSVSPVLIIVLSGINAINRWKRMVNSEGTLRKEWFYPFVVRIRFGLIDDIPEVLHYSENYHYAKKENRYFFPESMLEPFMEEDDRVTDFCNLYINPTLVKGLVELVKRKPMDPIVYLGEWLLLHNPFQPKLPDKVALVPT